MLVCVFLFLECCYLCTHLCCLYAEPRMAVAAVENTLPGGGTSPRTGASSAPVNHDSVSYRPPRTALSPPMTQRHSLASGSSLKQGSLLTGQLSTHSVSSRPHMLVSPLHIGNFGVSRRGRSSSFAGHEIAGGYKLSPSGTPTGKKVMSVASASLAKARARNAQKENDAMVYLDGQQVYTCAQCRTHLTSHDDIISKSFHGRNGEFAVVMREISSWKMPTQKPTVCLIDLPFVLFWATGRPSLPV